MEQPADKCSNADEVGGVVAAGLSLPPQARTSTRLGFPCDKEKPPRTRRLMSTPAGPIALTANATGLG